MRYESEVLYDLMKRDGLLNPSQEHLPYESELKEKYVDEVKGAYPKVIDYRSEWLNYAYENPIGEFPYETLTNVTEATINNVVPYAYKSAILKGNTLVNLTLNTDIVFSKSNNDSNDIYTVDPSTPKKINITQMSANSYWRYISKDINLSMLKPNTKYILFATKMNGIRNVQIASGAGGNRLNTKVENITNNYAIITTNDLSELSNSTGQFLYFGINDFTEFPQTISIEDIMLIEYQDGMENWDISYFEGMQSVKMPVLTTIGKNLFDNNLLSLANVKVNVVNIGENEYSIKTEETKEWNSQNTYKAIKLKQGEKICVHGSIKNITNVRLYKNDFNNQVAYFNPTSVPTEYLPFDLSYTATEDCTILIRFWLNGVNSIGYVKDVMVEIGEKTPYEPFKSNILTVNEPIELRGIGDVQDTLDCLTGEMTERVGEIVLDGSENWSYHENLSTDALAVFSVYNDFGYLEWLGVGSILCDKFPITQKRATDNNAQEGIYDKDGWAGKNKIPLIINKDRLSSVSVDGLKLWLSNNQLKLQFKLQNKSIKTVALTSVNQAGVPSTFRPIEGTMNLRTDGTPIKPLFSGEIPVEAIIQNIASFIE